jgi:wyosine [tRNA(Phe)-imidazoG37] synthetase (radical SAM superfamily)
LDRIVAQLPERLTSKPDYITLSGSGEPTLYSRVGELIAEIKALTDVPVAVLTNGSLLWQEELRRQLLRADLVIPSLDAGDDAVFQAVNRPHEQISFGQMVDGLVAFRQEFKGAFWLEVMVVGGYTSTVEEIGKLAACVDRIQPDRVQLNTVTRPPAEDEAGAVSAEQLSYFCSLFRPAAEVIADFRAVHQEAEFVASRNEVLPLLQRRPCSVSDVASGLGMHENEVVKYLEELRVAGAIEAVTIEGKHYYRAIHQD